MVYLFADFGIDLFGTVTEDLIFRDHTKYHPIPPCPASGSIPFGIVYGYHGSITTAGLAFDDALFFWLDLNDLGHDLISSVAVGYKKIWYIDCLSSGKWMTIGY